MIVVLATAVMIILHTSSGVEIDVNTQEITNMRGPDPSNPGQYFTKDAHCLINMSDGKYVTVKETCEKVRQIIGSSK